MWHISSEPGAQSGELREDGRSKMEIKRGGSQPSSKGPADWFTGTVRIDPLFDAPEPARVRGASVTFEPGAHLVRR
jgi:quercetin dioxygenase-like cupin family protein